MEVAILGYGEQGRSAYEYWREGNDITLCDQNEIKDRPGNVAIQFNEHYLQHLDRFDLIVRSPSIHPRDIARANSPDILNKVTTNTNEFFRVCPTKNIIGVTGTKGKGTSSTLIAKMLKAAGKTVHLGGNIGTPPLDLLKHNIQPDDWVVLELANFQLVDLKFSPHIAACLMVVPEHMDWHESFEEYTTAKQQLFMHQTSDDIAIYFADSNTSRQIAAEGAGQKLPFFAPPGAWVNGNMVTVAGAEICMTDELKLLGQHNWQNVCAAVTAVWQVIQDIPAMRSVLTTFSGLDHRLELVREVNGVKYYDDSFGTTPETAIVAIQAFEQPKVVILGGSDKGANYDELAKVVASGNVRLVVLIGDQAARIREGLEKAGFHNFASSGDNMTNIMEVARADAQPGDVVLLSPACASFDMFKNYKDRGEQFKAAVQALV